MSRAFSNKAYIMHDLSCHHHYHDEHTHTHTFTLIKTKKNLPASLSVSLSVVVLINCSVEKKNKRRRRRRRGKKSIINLLKIIYLHSSTTFETYSSLVESSDSVSVVCLNTHTSKASPKRKRDFLLLFFCLTALVAF